MSFDSENLSGSDANLQNGFKNNSEFLQIYKELKDKFLSVMKINKKLKEENQNLKNLLKEFKEQKQIQDETNSNNKLLIEELEQKIQEITNNNKNNANSVNNNSNFTKPNTEDLVICNINFTCKGETVDLEESSNDNNLLLSKLAELTVDYNALIQNFNRLEAKYQLLLQENIKLSTINNEVFAKINNKKELNNRQKLINDYYYAQSLEFMEPIPSFVKLIK